MFKFKRLFFVFSILSFSFVLLGASAEAIGGFIKVIFIGNFDCGKTTLYNIYGGLPPTRNHTYDLFLRQKLLEHNGDTFVIKLWDTAGEEEYHGVIKEFFRESDIAFVVVDVKKLADKRFDFDALGKMYRRWCNEIWRESPNCRVILVGSKKDLLVSDPFLLGEANRLLSQAVQDARQFGNRYVEYFMISARDNANVISEFDRQIHLALNTFRPEEIKKEETVLRTRVVTEDIFRDETYYEKLPWWNWWGSPERRTRRVFVRTERRLENT